LVLVREDGGQHEAEGVREDPGRALVDAVEKKHGDTSGHQIGCVNVYRDGSEHNVHVSAGEEERVQLEGEVDEDQEPGYRGVDDSYSSAVCGAVLAEFNANEHAIKTATVADCEARGPRDGAENHARQAGELEEESIQRIHDKC